MFEVGVKDCIGVGGAKQFFFKLCAILGIRERQLLLCLDVRRQQQQQLNNNNNDYSEVF